MLFFLLCNVTPQKFARKKIFVIFEEKKILITHQRKKHVNFIEED